jgi:hypothetical protein
MLDGVAKYGFGQGDQIQHLAITQSIKDLIGHPPGREDLFVPHDREVLRNIGLSGSHRFHQFLDAEFLGIQGGDHLQPEGMGQGLHTSGRSFNVGIVELDRNHVLSASKGGNQVEEGSWGLLAPVAKLRPEY